MDPIVSTILAVGSALVGIGGSIAATSAMWSAFKATTESAVRGLVADVADLKIAARSVPSSTAFDSLRASVDEMRSQMGIIISTIAADAERSKATSAEIARLDRTDRETRDDVIAEIRAVESRIIAQVAQVRSPPSRSPKR